MIALSRHSRESGNPASSSFDRRKRDSRFRGSDVLLTAMALLLATPLSAGLHLLEVESVGGGDVLPGGAALLEGGDGAEEPY